MPEPEKPDSEMPPIRKGNSVLTDAEIAQVLAQAPSEVKVGVESGMTSEAFQGKINQFRDALLDKDRPPYPGDPRTQLAMAIITQGNENVLPSTKRAAAAVLNAALLQTMVAEVGDD